MIVQNITNGGIKDYMKTKEEILYWLRQHDWYQSFKTKTICYNRVTFDEYLSELIKENNPEKIISCAFFWHTANEGENFWGEINDEYLKWLKSDSTNKTMKQTIEIEVPEGKKAVWKDGKVVFEDIKPELPKTWEEFCGKYPEVKNEYYIDSSSETVACYKENRHVSFERNLLPSKEVAEAHLALIQLHQLRDCYRQGWVPDWNNSKQTKYCIENYINTIYCIENYINTIYNISYTTYVHFLAFQSEEIAKEFLHNFEDLIKKAGDLI